MSKELKALEENQFITRKMHSTFPSTVEYAIIEQGLALEKVIMELKDRGVQHRKKNMV